MDTKHTPGPWGVHGDDGTLIGPSNGKQMIAGAKHSHVVKEWAVSLEEAQANARLIAAAPDMLAALREVVSSCCGDTLNEAARERKTHALYLAAAAIKKAEGRA